MNARTIGILIGMIIGLLICGVVFITANNNRKIKTEYDERQNEVRGKGFKYGFYTAVILLGVVAVLDMMEVELPMENAVTSMTVICISVMVNAIYNIINEGYWGLNNNKKRYGIYMALIALLNAVVAYICYKHGILFVNGKLAMNGVNLICSIMFVILFVTILIKDITTKDDEGEDVE